MITQSAYPYDPRVRREAEVLEKAGYFVDVLCLPFKGDQRIEKFGNVTAYRIFEHPQNQEKIVSYIYITLRFFFKVAFLLNKLSSVNKYDVIQIHNMPEFHVFSAFFQKIKGTPIVLDIHDLTPELFEEKWPHRKWLKPIVTALEKISCRYSDHLITVTEGCKEILVERGNPEGKVTLVLNTADVHKFPFNDDRSFKPIYSDLKLLYHGTVAERFGLHSAIKALPKIIASIPNTMLYVYGKYDETYRMYLLDLMKELKVEDNVYLGGTKNWEELIEIMNEVDIEVVPYVSNKYMNLSLSTKIFECAAVGLPVAASRLHTLQLSFDDTTIKYFDSHNSDDIADKIIQLARDDMFRKQMVKNAYEAVSHISGKIMLDRYLKLMQKLMGVKISQEIKHLNPNARSMV